MAHGWYSLYWQDSGKQIGDLENVHLAVCPRVGETLTFSTDICRTEFDVQVARVVHSLVTLDGSNFNGDGLGHQIMLYCTPITGEWPEAWADNESDADLIEKLLGRRTL